MSTGADSLIKKLEELKREEESLPQILEFYEKLLRIQTRVGQCISVPNPSSRSEAISKHPEQGKPLITFDGLALDWVLLRDTFEEVATLFAEYPELFGAVPEELMGSGAKRFPTKKVVKAWFKGAKLPPSILTKDVDENLIVAIIHATLKPFLVSHAKTLIDSIDQERWRRSYCPVCGGSPDFAFLDKERGSRWLLCSRCDTEWLFQRLQCPYCGTQDQNALAYFTDDKGLYRLYVCEQCKRYLKVIDLRQAESEILLPLERLYTLDIDRQAQEQGYNPYDKATTVKEDADTTGRTKKS